MRLLDWQQFPKPIEQLLYNCSEYTHLNDEWVPFPIGMGWKFIQYTNTIHSFHTGKHTNLVLCAINMNTDQRRRPHPKNRHSIIQTLSKHSIPNRILEPQTYFEELSKYKFIISPEGNGIDCHRHYEALIAGCIPIIEEHSGIRNKYGNCPILYTQDYSEITPEYLTQKYNEMLYTDYDFSKLFLQSYDLSTQQEIKQNGNYWSTRLDGKKWYI